MKNYRIVAATGVAVICPNCGAELRVPDRPLNLWTLATLNMNHGYIKRCPACDVPSRIAYPKHAELPPRPR